MDKIAQRKAIASARYFKNKGEVDMWHTVWHEGKPYDYHLLAEYDYVYHNDFCIVVIYEVDKLEDGTYQTNTGNELWIHQFKDLPKDYYL